MKTELEKICNFAWKCHAWRKENSPLGHFGAAAKFLPIIGRNFKLTTLTSEMTTTPRRTLGKRKRCRTTYMIKSIHICGNTVLLLFFFFFHGVSFKSFIVKFERLCCFLLLMCFLVCSTVSRVSCPAILHHATDAQIWVCCFPPSNMLYLGMVYLDLSSRFRDDSMTNVHKTNYPY